MQVPCRAWIKWVSAGEGRYPVDPRRWLHPSFSSQATVMLASQARNDDGGGGRGPSPRSASSDAGCLGSPAWVSGPGGGCPGPAFAHPWAAARPSGPVMVTHHLVAGSRAKAAATARESAASSGPNPATSPGEGDQPSQVDSGSTRFTDPRTDGPGG